MRHFVADRAAFLCEYCLIHEEDTFFGCHVDHVISIKHGGSTEPENLAYACAFCNRFKGSDIGSFVTPGGALVRFFNPRVDTWHEHFALDAERIVPRTQIAVVTERILQLNTIDRLIERRTLMASDRFPPPAARKLIGP